MENDRKSGFSDVADYSPERTAEVGLTLFSAEIKAFSIDLYISMRQTSLLCVLSAPPNPACPNLRSSPLHCNLPPTCVLSLQDRNISPINQAWDLMVSVSHFNKDFT